MRILITGGCGFLGSNLAAHAMAREDNLTLFDNLYREGSERNLEWLKGQGKFRFIRGDVRNADDVASLVRDVDPEGIFHLAGQVAMAASIANPRMDFEVNVTGTVNLLESVRQNAPEAVIVYSSTNKVYGDLEQFSYRETATRYECVEKPNGFDETTPLDFHSPYGCSKGAADQYTIDYARIYGLRTVVLRHSSMYGGRQFATYDQGWVGWFCQKALEAKDGVFREPFTISGTGKQVRDVLHADDTIKLYFSALDRIEIAKGQTFNVGGGKSNSLSLLELFGMLEGLTGTRLEYTKLPARASDQRVFIADYGKAERLLGWAPRVNMEAGIRDMLVWLKHAG